MKYQGNDWLVELNNMLTKVRFRRLFFRFIFVLMADILREFTAGMDQITLLIAY